MARLSAAAIRLALALAHHTAVSPPVWAPRWSGWVAVSMTRLGRDAGLLDARTVRRALGELYDAELLDGWFPGRGRRPSVFLVSGEVVDRHGALGEVRPGVLPETAWPPFGEGWASAPASPHPAALAQPGLPEGEGGRDAPSIRTEGAFAPPADSAQGGTDAPAEGAFAPRSTSRNSNTTLDVNRGEGEKEPPSSPLVDNLGKAELAEAWKRSRGLELRQGPAAERMARQHGVTAAQLDLVLAYTLTRPAIAAKPLTFYLAAAQWEGLLAEAEAWRGAKARGTADDWRRDPARLRAAIENVGRRIEHFHPSDPQHAELRAKRAELELLLAACTGTEAVA